MKERNYEKSIFEYMWERKYKFRMEEKYGKLGIVLV